MNSSGIKRGLAGSAITALAITGLPFLATSASAQPIGPADGTLAASNNNAVDAGDVDFLNPDQANAPVTTEAYNLVAIANDEVDRVQFQFKSATGAQFVNIGSPVSRVNGAFATTWTPSGSGQVRAVPVDAQGVFYDGANGTVDASDTESVSAVLPTQATTVKLGGDTNVGVWDSNLNNAASGDYSVGVQGTTTNLQDSKASALDDNFAVEVEQRTGGSGSNEIQTDAQGNFSGVLDLDPAYTFPAGGPDQLVIGAEPHDYATPGGGDGLLVNVEDATVKTLYLQQLGTVAVSAADTSLQPNETTNVTITVQDAGSKPVAGATVYRTSPGGGTVAVPGRTNAQGVLVDTGVSGTLSGQYTYFVNAPATNKAVANTATTNEPALGDKSATVAINIYQPGLSDIDVVAKHGEAADLDELNSVTAGDYTLVAKDQEGTPLANENLVYTWTVDPFNAALPSRTTREIAAAATGANGRTTARFASAGDFETVPGSFSGTWTLKVFRKSVGGQGAFQADPVDFTYGEAEVVFDPAERAQGALAGSTTVGMSLELQDGTAIGSIDRDGDDAIYTNEDVDREADVAYTKGDESAPGAGDGDSRIAPFQEQDQDVVESASATNARIHFDADGAASLKINDATPEDDEELDAELVADPAAAVGAAGDADESMIFIDFLESVTAEALTLDDTNYTSSNYAAPGRPVTYEFLVKNENGTPLSNKEVEVSVDGDAFITGNPKATLTDDQLDGVWADNGQTATVKTDGNGIATVTVGIERSADFDDDFQANINVTATVDGLSASNTEVFRAEDAVDLDRVEIVAADENSANLPDAQVGFEEVAYDVFAYDQFGNLSMEAFSAGDANNTRADLNIPFGAETSSLDSLPVLIASARAETAQTVSVSVTDREGKDASKTAGDSADAINWYAVDFAASSFELQQQGAESVPTGSRVTEVLTVTDQKGQAVTGLDVEFLRSGPGDQDSDGNAWDRTDVNGQAFYDFTGGAAGVAQISAVVKNNVTGNDLRVGTAEDTVTFVGEDIDPETPGEVEVLISGDSNGGSKDVIRAQVDDAAEGGTITLFKIRGTKADGNKRLVQVREDIVPEGGTLTFKVADRNGNKKTRFIAKVTGEGFKAAKSNTQKLR